jgi:hypothetical protein
MAAAMVLHHPPLFEDSFSKINYIFQQQIHAAYCPLKSSHLSCREPPKAHVDNGSLS